MNVSYTISEIDDALRLINGHYAVRLSDSGWSRPHELIRAATRCWIDQRSEDHHTAIVRAALIDLERGGAFHPKDGLWPEDATHV